MIRRGSSGAQHHWGQAQPHLVEQPGVVELADQVAAPEHPGVAVTHRGNDLVVHRADLAGHHPDVVEAAAVKYCTFVMQGRTPQR